jgi:hypothetical protein
MKYDVFANIMAMYPTTPTEKISKELGVPVKTIKVLANSMGIYKEGRKHSDNCCQSTVVTYNARTAEVGFVFGPFEIKYSKKPVKLQVAWKDL